MEEKEVGLTAEEAILKGQQGYRVVWEEEEEVTPVEVKDTIEIKTNSSDEVTKKVFPNKKIHHIHKHQQSIEFLVGGLGFIVLVFLFFYKPILFWIVLWIILFSLSVFWLIRKYQKSYVDRMQQNVVYLKIKNPILTGFEIALGIGIFAAICILIGLIILLIIALGAGYGIWTLLSGFFL